MDWWNMAESDRPTQATLLNVVLVWKGCRTVALPSPYYNESLISAFISSLNHISCPTRRVHFECRPYRCLITNSHLEEQIFIIRDDNLALIPHQKKVDDEEIGRLLGMLPINVDWFVKEISQGNSHLAIEEHKSSAQLYAESFNSTYLNAHNEMDNIAAHWRRMVGAWNTAMYELQFPFLFKGNIYSDDGVGQL